MTKTCSRCGADKDVNEFSPGSSDGRCSWCKSCVNQQKREYRIANRDKVKSQQRNSYERNREIILDRNRAYRNTKPELIKQRNRTYHLNHKLELKQARRTYLRSIPGIITSWWGSLNSRTINGKHPNPYQKSYLSKGVRLELTRDQLAQFVRDNEKKILEIQATGDIPSIDRIHDDGHYAINNIRVIPFKENAMLGSIKSGKMQTHKKKSIQT